MKSSPQLVLVGLSHRTAPVAIREKVAVPEGESARPLEALARLEQLRGAVVVSTCNRVEVYSVASGEPAAAVRAIRMFLAAQEPIVEQHLYEHTGGEAVRHLFRVASSLDSMVVGEPQILGQVKSAFAAAEAAGSAGGLVGRACRRAFQVAKRVRTETAVGRAAVSMSFAAVELGKKILGSLHGRTVLVIGAGKMSALAAKHMSAAGVARLLVTNRTASRAEALAREVGGEARPWEKLGELLAESDVVICSTAAPYPVVTLELVQAARKARRHKPLFFVDLAVPRDVDPRINDLDDVYVYDVDDLDKVIDENREARAEEAARAEAIVSQEAEAFMVAARDDAAPVLRQLRQHADEIARLEVERTLQKLGEHLSEPQRKSLHAMAAAIVNKILHTPSARLRRAAAEDDGRLIDAALELFVSDEPPRGAPAVAVVPVAAAAASTQEEVVPEPGAPQHAAEGAAAGRLKH